MASVHAIIFIIKPTHGQRRHKYVYMYIYTHAVSVPFHWIRWTEFDTFLVEFNFLTYFTM